MNHDDIATTELAPSVEKSWNQGASIT